MRSPSTVAKVYMKLSGYSVLYQPVRVRGAVVLRLAMGLTMGLAALCVILAVRQIMLEVDVAELEELKYQYKGA